MGSCVSVHKNPESVMKLRLSFGTKSNKYVIPSSPIKEKTTNVDLPIGVHGLKSQMSPTRSSRTFADFGSKEETFFESHPWLESDCEDDFFSVNGDFTPSRGNTPVHHNFSMATAQVKKALVDEKILDSNPEPSPTEKKKRLSELFQDSINEENKEYDGQNIASGNQSLANGTKTENKPSITGLPQKSTNGTPFHSGVTSVCSSERTPNGDYRADNERSVKSVQCCLPRLLSSRSFNDKKKSMSPVSSCR